MADRNTVVCAPQNFNIKILKWRVREGFPVNNSQVILLYEIVDNNLKEKEVKRLKSSQNGVVKKRLYKDGAIIEKGAPILELAECIHATVIKDLCADCGADLRQSENGNLSEASVPMVHSVPELKVSQQHAQQLGRADTERLLEDHKLVLLVDLDQTLIHTTNDNVPNNIKGIYHFQLYGPHSPWYHTRLRPGTLEFLNNISKYFELHICTFGARNYAHMIAQFLDPDGKFFSHRILSRDECFNVNSKTDNLKALFPCGDSMVCIIDDREDVWNMASNLIQVKPYHFFQHTGDINAPPELSKHELDGKGVDFKELNKFVLQEEKENSDLKMKEKVEDSKNSSTQDIKEVSEMLSATESTSLQKDESKNTPNEIDCQKKNAKPTDINAENTIETPKENIELIEIDDPDDYLFYLEDILKRIHRQFYAIYDKTKEIIDLKVLVPKIRLEVLLGTNLVFSGLVPTQMKLEQSRAYLIARSLGANVNQHLSDETTHLVAATAGTFKVNAARKRKDVYIVTPDWLWCCAERWEHVRESLFPLDPNKPSKMRQPPPHCHSPEHVVNYNEKTEIPAIKAEPKFIDTINPLLSFSNDDLDEMNQEFNQFFESDSSSEEESMDIENPAREKNRLKRKREDTKENPPHTEANLDDVLIQTEIPEKRKSMSDGDNESLNDKFRQGEDISSILDMDTRSESEGSEELVDEEDDGEWNMMGAALEREFLGLD